MKKATLIFSLMIALGFANYANAQKDFRFGLLINPSLAWLGNDTENLDNSVRGKFGFGLVADIAFSERYSLLTGVNYMGRGGKVEDSDFAATYSSNYVEVPFALKMSTAQLDKMTYFAKFGGTLGILANEANSTFSQKGNIALPDGLNDRRAAGLFHTSFLVGLGTEYELRGGTSLVGGIDLNLSFFNNIRSRTKPFADNPTLRYNQVSLFIAVLF
ncbi:MAG: PorT family protein [Schleiferiaceae bacterium]|nr:PorT family protein [Schleiferiaceae bacterium]